MHSSADEIIRGIFREQNNSIKQQWKWDFWNQPAIQAEFSRPIPGHEEIPTTAYQKASRKIKNIVVKTVRTARAGLNLRLQKDIGKEGEYQAPDVAPIHPLGMFGSVVQTEQMAAASALVENVSTMLLKGAEYYKNHPRDTEDLNTRKLDQKWAGWMNERGINYIREILAIDFGVNMDEFARKMGREMAATGKVTPFINRDFFLKAYTVVVKDMTMDSSTGSRPIWLLTGKGRAINPLFGWSWNTMAEATYRTTRNADFSAVKGSLYVTGAGILGIGLLYALMRDEYEEKVIRKKSRNLDPWSWRGMIDAMNRLGVYGHLGELATQTINQDSTREFRVDNRILIFNSIYGLARVSRNIANQGFMMDYPTVARPLIQSVGGSGYLQYAQIANNVLGGLGVLPKDVSFPDFGGWESKMTSRIHVKNALNSAGRAIGIEVKRGFGASGTTTKWRPHTTKMQLAAYNNDAGAFKKAMADSIRSVMGNSDRDREEAEKYIINTFTYNHPLRSVFKTYPTRQDYGRLLKEMSPWMQQDVRDAVNNYNHYLEQLGRSPFVGKDEESETKGKSSSKSKGKKSSSADIDRMRRRAVEYMNR
jgi:hypothetical protein